MMDAGQPIDPGLVQALQSISSSSEDQQNLVQQMKMAQGLRAPQQDPNAMAGKVVYRQPLGAGLAHMAQNAVSTYAQMQALKQMQANAATMRSSRGTIISRLAAEYNLQHDPTKNHPDTNDALMNGNDGGSAIQNPYSMNAQADMGPDSTSYIPGPGESPD